MRRNASLMKFPSVNWSISNSRPRTLYILLQSAGIIHRGYSKILSIGLAKKENKMLVQTKNGTLCGAEMDGISVFKGIPYAKPPRKVSQTAAFTVAFALACTMARTVSYMACFHSNSPSPLIVFFVQERSGIRLLLLQQPAPRHKKNHNL